MRLRFSFPLVKSPATRLFLISFLILFLELALIRFIPSQIRYVGYFSNIVLLASFVGIGLGTIFWKKIKLPFYLFPLIFFFSEILIGLLKYDLVVSSDQVIYFNLGFGQLMGEPIFLLPLIFFLVVLVLILPSRVLGELFNRVPPLSAYSINIGGSILGIFFFSLLSFGGSGPTVWFAVIFLISFLLMERPYFKAWPLVYGFIFFFSPLFELVGEYQMHQSFPGFTQVKIRWSPYYKISLYQAKTEGKDFFLLNVNNIGHQQLLDPDLPYAEKFYQYPYQLFPERKFKDVLVIGSGGGNDVAKALREGAEKVVAVEIDPAIVELGKKYHPEKPYSSAKTQIVVNDARSYLVEGKEKFDLIIFALTDSLTLVSGASNLRLESYLFTKESFQSARAHLKEGGFLVLYNYYRAPWIMDKLALLLRETFGRDPSVFSFPSQLGAAAVLIGAEPNVTLPTSSYRLESAPSMPTDDWPFLYLKNRTIPKLYWSYLGVILLVLILAFPWLIRKAKAKFDWGFFFLGAAFMLLETKNVVQFSLLFGSTWLTNSFVFGGLLFLVLVAIWVAKKFPQIKLAWLYLLLFILIALAYFFPQKELLSLDYFPRLFLAILLNFSPVFVANIIFAQIFKNTKIAPAAYGANIFGSFIGGVFEYSSLVWGYQNLILFVALFYFLALLFTLKRKI